MKYPKIPHLAVAALALAAIMPLPALAAGAETTPPAASAGLLEADQLGALEKMTPEQRHEFFRQRHEQMKNMSPEEREAYRAKRKAWFDSLSPEQKEKMKNLRKEQRKAMKEKWEKMSPEEKEALKAKKKAEFEALPPEQKEAIKKHRAEMRDKHKSRMKEKWEKMSPEEKEEWKKKMKDHRGHKKMKGHGEGKDAAPEKATAETPEETGSGHGTH